MATISNHAGRVLDLAWFRIHLWRGFRTTEAGPGHRAVGNFGHVEV